MLLWHWRQVSESLQKLLSCKMCLLSTLCTCPAQPFVFMVTHALGFPFSPCHRHCCVFPPGTFCPLTGRAGACAAPPWQTFVCRLGMEGGGSEGFSLLCTKVAFVFIPFAVCCQLVHCTAASFCVGLWWIFWGYASRLVPDLNNSRNAYAVPCLILSLLLQELSISFQACVFTLNADKNSERFITVVRCVEALPAAVCFRCSFSLVL